MADGGHSLLQWFGFLKSMCQEKIMKAPLRLALHEGASARECSFKGAYDF
jgi:hypothetical protein